MYKLSPRNFILPLLFPCVACMIQWVFWHEFQPFIWFLFYPAVFFSAQIGGRWGGLTATLLSVALVIFFFVEPVNSFKILNPNVNYSIIVFIAMGFLFSGFQERLKREQYKLKESESALRKVNEGLEGLVNERALALQQANQRFENLVENMLEGVQILGFDWSYLYLNRAAEIHNRRANTELLGKKYMDMWPGIESTSVFAVIKRCLEERVFESLENEFVFPDGHVGWFELRIEPVPEGVFILSFDISERKLAEKKMRESEKLYRLISENSTDVIWTLDLTTGRFTYVSPSVYNLRGMTPEEVMAEPMQAAITTEAQQNISENLPQRIEKYLSGDLSARTRITEVDQVCKDGSIVPTEVVTNLITDSENRVVEVLGITRNITERKQTEKLLRENEARLRLALQAAKAGIWEWDLQTNQNIWSEELWKVYGLEPYSAEPCYDTWLSTIHPDDLQRTSQNVQDAAMNETELNTEWRVIDKDGSQRWLMSRGQPLRNSDGKAVRFIGTVLDITERKLAEASIHESEANLSALIENTDGSIWAVDKQYGLIVGNREFHKNVSAVLGRRLETGESVLLSKFPPQANAEWQGYYDRALRGERFTNETQTRFREAPHYIEYRFSPIREETGEIRGVTVYGRDITERKQTEETLKYHAHLLENVNDAVVASDKDYHLTAWNSAAENIYGWKASEVLGRNGTEIIQTIFPNQDKEKVLASIAANGFYRGEATQLRKDGTRFPVDISSIVLHDKQGQITGYLSVNRDITERKLTQEQMLKMLEELERSNEELEQFAYVASHDLQEPLRAVAGMVQLLQKRYHGQLDERADEYINLAMDGSNRMQTLITDLLEYSRVDRRGNPIQSTDANKALKSALRNLHESIQKGGATITNEILPTVEADATQLTLLFQNLIGNAIKFHSECPPQIHIAVEDLSDAWLFSVRDNGIGIEPQYFERIFLIFQRLHTRRDYPGTGIGLSICKKIVERHGGRIWVESELGQGTTFRFTIPHRS